MDSSKWTITSDKNEVSLNAYDQQTIRQKFGALATLLFVFYALILIAVNALFFNLDQQKQQREIDTVMTLTNQFIQHDFDSNISNIKFLSNSRSIKDYLSKGITSTHSNIEALFINLATSSKSYAQIRLIDENGQELVRVDYRDGTIERKIGSALQNKSSRYYFKNTIALENDQVYISPLDLNVEQGIVEQPHLPMIRYGQPLYDDSNNIKGAIIFNYFGDIVLDIFREQMKTISAQAMLINNQGYWLLHPNTEYEWGFMFNNNRSLSYEQPLLWQEIISKQNAKMVVENHRYTWQTVKDRNAESAPMSDEWKIIIVNSTQLFNLSKIFSHLSFLYPVFAIYIIGLILIWFLVKNHVQKKKVQNELMLLNKSLKKIVLERTKELMITKDITIMSMATLAEIRDNETGQHLIRTQYYAKELTIALSHHPQYRGKINPELIREMYKSAPLHDIGKVAIPDRILLKPGKLTSQEFQMMKQHTIYGANAISTSINEISEELNLQQGNTFLNIARDIAYYHHEKWDGSGYPFGLKAEQIPLAARIMAIADVFDALACKRVYKHAFSRKTTEKIMREGRGLHFDPLIFDVFWSIKDIFWNIHERHSDIDPPVKGVNIDSQNKDISKTFEVTD